MSDTKDCLVRLMYQHQEDALANLDTGNEECRCGKQGDQHWRPHFADVLIEEFGL